MAKKFLYRREVLLLLYLYSLTVSAQKSSLEGRVIDEQTSQPVPGVTVLISGTALQEKTNSEGYFHFEDPPSGEQILEFSVNSYFSKRFPVIIEAGKDIGLVYLQPDLSEIQQQTAIISLSEQELDEDDGSYVNVSGLLQASRDVFLNAAAFDFSSTFFRPRGYDSEFGKLLINGIEMNKFYNGRPLWSNWGGLNDVQRNQEFSMGMNPSDVSFGSLAGTTNIVMRASRYSQGGKISYAIANRSYSGRLMASYHTGLSETGWAFSISVARRYAEESFVDGSIYDANSFFASVEKKINTNHSLNLTAFYTPNRRGKTSPNTREVFYLKGNKYNSYWGYQDGEIRNSRIQKVEEPVIMLNHYWNLSSKTTINSGFAYQFGKVGSSRIDYGGSRIFTGGENEDIFIGGGSNPDPAYYQKMPSYFLRFENDPDYREAYLAQQDFLENGQIDWASMYLANQTQSLTGGNSLYVLYEDRNDDKQFWANTILRTELNSRTILNAAVSYRNLKSNNFAEVLDLLGGNAYLNVDSFSQGEQAQNDLLHPNRLVTEGDKFKYHFELSASEIKAFSQIQYFGKSWEYYAGLDLSSTTYQREGYFKNGNFPDNSLGESDPVDFQNYSLKAGLTYKITGRHILNFHAGHFTKPPTLRNTFSNARQNNNIVRGLKQEKVEAFDLSYVYRSPSIKGRITGFYGGFKDATEISFYFADGISGFGRDSTTAFVQEVLTDVEKRHVGIEFGWEVQVISTIKLKTSGSLGEYIYNNNPSLYLTSDDFSNVREMGSSFLKNYRLSGGPQRAAQVGFEYRDPDYWWISATANYFSHAFVDVAPLTRTRNFFTDTDGLPIISYDEAIGRRLLKQEQLNDYYLVNLVGGKSWRIKDKYLGFFASINNILDTSYITGGYEQSRNVNYTLLKIDKEREKPIFGTKYWFGPDTTYYAHVYLRF